MTKMKALDHFTNENPTATHTPSAWPHLQVKSIFHKI